MECSKVYIIIYAIIINAKLFLLHNLISLRNINYVNYGKYSSKWQKMALFLVTIMISMLCEVYLIST